MALLFLIIIGVFLLGALCSLLLQKNGKTAHYAGSFFAITGSILGIVFSSQLLLTKSTASFIIPTSFPLLSITIVVDMLSAFFILIISVIALASSIYGVSYMEKYIKEYNVGVFGFFYNIFLASLLLVVSAGNSLYFLLVWELMSLTSYFLVIFENKSKENIKAGLSYLVMTHVGTAFILIAFLLLYNATGSFDFTYIKQHANSIPLLVKDIVFILAFIGFGTKAGIVPLHVWLPRAHPAAPSHVSALMSGVMIKTAIFMMIRLFIDIVPSQHIWWGVVVLFAGATSSLLGVLYALSEHDIKKLLAYHSVENIGIILMGLGSAMIFYPLGMVSLAGLGIVAAMYHAMNHAVFKSLLFLGAGSVVQQTHTRNIEEYGGLIKKMPYTALFFLIGSVAISALPPFNGFASEWLTYQSLFAGVVVKSVFIKASFVIAIASLAFTGGLAAACFVKAFGITFLAKPRSQESTDAHESPFLMNVSMALLAALCLVLGVFISFITPYIIAISQSLTAMKNRQAVITNQQFVSLDLMTVFLAITGVCFFVYVLVYLKTRKQKEDIVPTWDCGAPPLTARAEITATGFARSIITIFGGILKPTKQHEVEYSDADSRYFLSSKTVTLHVPNLYEQYLYKPLQKIIYLISSRVTLVQSGNINHYLLYIFITLIGLLIWARI